MSTTGTGGAGGLVIGKREPRGSTLVRCDAPFPFSTPVDARSGGILARDRVGFPHVLILRCPAGVLPEAGKLRLMKAFSLAVEKVREAGRWSGTLARILITIDPAAAGDPECSPGPAFVLPGRWLEACNRSLAGLRGAVLSLVEGSVGHLEQWRQPPAGPGGAAAKVLLFRNIFTKDVDSGDARQINPGIHYLVSSLLASDAQVVLLDGKIPLQDVCARPPDVDAPLRPGQFLDDPEELERALAAHPDLDLVCLTLLERSFGQVRHIAGFIRERSSALIACGGVFPTVTPEHCFAHLGDVDLVVRGDGERILPRIAGAVAGRQRDDGAVVEALAGLEGVIARCGETTVSSQLGSVNRVMDLDESRLDYSFFERENVEHGLSLSTSRGCVYSCRFCSVMDKKLWRARSVEAVMRDLEAYSARLLEIYGSAGAVPSTARRLQIWDDDFFLDPRRASALLGRMTEAGFTTTFVQGTVSSFFLKEGRRITRRLDEELLDSIPRRFFTDVGGLKIGTESFCDRELGRLGKPYDHARIRALVLALSRRGLRQDHYMILCNRRTTLDDLLENLEAITALRWSAGRGFSVLEPSWLINLFPTALYRACQVRGTEHEQPTAGVLRQEGHDELDYPFVLPERPERPEVFDIVRRFPAGMHFGAAGSPDWTFDGIYDPGDADYLRVFAHVRRALVERLDAVQDEGEIYRIEKALATRLGGDRWLPSGLLMRVAPALDLDEPALDGASRLTGYLETLLESCGGELGGRCRVEAAPEGALLEVTIDGTRVDFLVQRYAPGAACAFSTPNLAFIVRTRIEGEEERRSKGGVIEKVKQVVSRHDRHDLE